MAQFQAYVRFRLGEMRKKLPPTLDAQAAGELAFLERQVIEDHMPRRKRVLRDPLRGVPKRDINMFNLPLLNRFVSEAGSILGRKLTGTRESRQRAITRAIKRAQRMALMPKIWKAPEYKHVSYADEYLRSERPVRLRNDGFDDAPDPRFPGVKLEATEDVKPAGLFGDSLSGLSRAPRVGGSTWGGPGQNFGRRVHRSREPIKRR